MKENWGETRKKSKLENIGFLMNVVFMSTMKLNLDTAYNKFQLEQSVSFLNSVRIIINKYFIT